MEGKPAAPTSIWGTARSYVYDKFIVSFTSKWYRAVLDLLPENSHVLDVGIGTGAALIANASIIRAKNLTFIGVDYDEAYVVQCRQLVAHAGLQDHIAVVHKSIYDYRPSDNRLYNHIYFSGSFMILPDPIAALNKVTDLLLDREDGRIFFTQTFELNKNIMLEWLKPNLQRITSIDFGHVSYEEDFQDAVHCAGLSVEVNELVDDGKRVEGVRETRVISVRSKLYVPESTESVA